MQKTIDMNQRELLIRLDERVKQVQLDVSKLTTTIIPMNEHLQLMKAMVDHNSRLDNLETFNTRFKVYLALSTTVGGLVSAIVVSIIIKLISGLFQ